MADEPARDPGLQLERTALAWQRTALAAAGVALLCALAWARLGLAPAAVGAVVVTSVPLLIGALRSRRGPDSASTWPWMLAVATSAVGLAVLGAAAALAAW